MGSTTFAMSAPSFAFAPAPFNTYQLSRFRNNSILPALRKPSICRTSTARPGTTTHTHRLPWNVTIPAQFSETTKVHLWRPPFVQIDDFLSADQCRALVEMQQQAQENDSTPERDNYLNYDSGAGHGYRQGVNPSSPQFAPILYALKEMFPARKRVVFEEALWHRPRTGSIVVRDVTTVRYRENEGVSSHVDGKDLTILIYLQEAAAGGETVFENVQLKFVPTVGQALLYESKRELTHHAAKVRKGEKWVLQLLVDYRVRKDDMHF